MRSMREWLEDADPLRSEPALGAEEARRMRERALDAADRAAASPSWRATRGWYAGGLLAAAAAAALFVDWPGLREPPQAPQPAAAQAGTAEATRMRQLHFVTARGTRVIWIFDDRFEEER